MKRISATLLSIAATFALSTQAHAEKHPKMPEAFGTAKTVFVESQDGDITNIRIDPDQRQAILDLQSGIQSWGRYTLSRSRQDADLIIVVYKGRLPRNTPNSGPLGAGRNPSTTGHIPMTNPTDPTADPDHNDGLTPDRDRLRVFTLKSDGKLKSIWSDELERGLDGENSFLFQRLKSDIEKAYPAPPPAKPTAP